MEIWTKYRKRVEGNCMKTSYAKNDIEYWRDKLFAVTISYVIPLCFIAVTPGIYIAYLTELYGLILFDILVIVSLIIIAHSSKLSVKIRKAYFTVLIYIVGVVLLFILGAAGPGLVYLLAVSVFSILIFDTRYAFVCIILNLVVCILYSFAIHYGYVYNKSLPNTSELELEGWVGISSNLIFLSAVFSLLIPKLYKGLQNSLEAQQQLQSELKLKQHNLEQSLDELQQKNKELEQFAYIASHDLQEPLRMITSFLTLLEKKYKNALDEKALKYIFYATDGAKRMQKIILDLLEYSRVGRILTKKELVNTGIIVEETLQLFERKIEELSAKIVYNKLPNIKAHNTPIRQLFQNIISNSLTYYSRDQQPLIEISAKELKSHWQFSVTDNGIGIDPAYQDKIFVIFQRLHNREDYAGSGIGLAICKKIVEIYGGNIWVVSREGEGATFNFTISK